MLRRISDALLQRPIVIRASEPTKHWQT